MKKLFKDASLILILAALWFVSGYVVGAVADAAHLFGYSVSIIAASLNVITGLLLLLMVTRYPYVHHIFYDGPAEREEGLFVIGMIWAIPMSLLIIALPMWLIIRLLSK